MNDFYKYATKHVGLNGNALNQYMNFTSAAASPVVGQYINPTIIEERPLNVASMDVFSRLMMDRIIFLGTEINDYSANVVQAQLLYLDSADPGKDISIYLNSPGGVVYAGLGIYDTMQYISSDVSTICTGMAASMASVLLVAGKEGKRFALPHSRVMIHQPMVVLRARLPTWRLQSRRSTNSRKNSILSSPIILTSQSTASTRMVIATIG